jgi:CRP-like cAMP-binding protein
MNNFNDEGREFIQDFFYANHRFGEPPLFLDGIYPANTEATEDSELLCISKHNFLKLITENATISIKIIQILSQCLHYKAVMAAEISTQDSEHRLLLLFDCIS